MIDTNVSNAEFNPSITEETPVETSEHGPVKYPEEIYKRVTEAKAALKGEIGQHIIDNLPSIGDEDFDQKIEKFILHDEVFKSMNDDTKLVLNLSWFSFDTWNQTWALNLYSTRDLMYHMTHRAETWKNVTRFRFEHVAQYKRSGDRSFTSTIRKDIEIVG